jgi:hypothetical protein
MMAGEALLALEHSLARKADAWNTIVTMLELYAFSTKPGVLDPSSEPPADLLKVPMNVEECRRMKDVNFLNAVFLNGRYDDSHGKEETIAVGNETDVKVVIFSPSELKPWLAKYEAHRDLLIQHKAEISLLETTIYRFLAKALEMNFVVLSRSMLYLQDYE